MYYRSFINNHYIIGLTLCLLLILSSCKKFVDVGNPSTSLTGETVFHSTPTATAALLGIYSRMISNRGNVASGNTQCIAYLTGLSSDELRNMSTTIENKQFNDNAVNADNRFVLNSFWNEEYQYLYSANKIIEQLPVSTGIPASNASELEGEARFMRSFFNFYLVNLFGDVPLVLTTDPINISTQPRTAAATIYEQIITDLQKAIDLLPETYLDGNNQPSEERTRPNKWAATALLARVYLYTGQWQKAETTVTKVIDQTGMYSLSSLDELFLKNSTEAIWQLLPVVSGFNTWEGFNLIQPSGARQAVLQDDLLAAFEAGDKRKSAWTAEGITNGVPYTYPFKYKVSRNPIVTEYSMVIRLAECYLIRAEARIQKDNISGGIEDLNLLRDRATDHDALPAEQLPQISSSLSKSDALVAVMQERRIELFSEWGHRWFDLKRTGMIDNQLGAVKGNNWQSFEAFFPIPQTELNRNPQLTQNPGY